MHTHKHTHSHETPPPHTQPRPRTSQIISLPPTTHSAASTANASIVSPNASASALPPLLQSVTAAALLGRGWGWGGAEIGASALSDTHQVASAMAWQ